MKPLLYEIKRTLTSKFVIAMIIVIILIALAAGFGIKSSLANNNPSPAQSVYTENGYYYDNGSYHLVNYAFNGYGQPMQNVNFNFTLSSPHTKTYSAVTGSDGFANFTVSAINASTLFNLPENYSYVTQSGNEHGYSLFNLINPTNASNLKLYQLLSHTDQYNMRIVENPNNPLISQILLFYLGTNGTPSPAVKVYYMGFNISNPAYTLQSSNLTESNMNYSQSLPSFYATTINVNFPLNSTYQDFVLGFFNSSNGLYGYAGPFSGVVHPLNPSGVNSLFLSIIDGLLGLFIPLMAVMSGYITYGKDKTTGILESVLVRPVTRSGALTSRYLANVVAILVASAISLFVMDAFFGFYLKSYLTITVILQSLWALFVESAAFIGIVYIFSHIFKSQGALLGISIALFLVLDLFWSIIIEIVLTTGFHYTIFSASYTSALYKLYFVNPGSYFSLITNFIISPQNLGLPTYGITATNLAIAGVLWIIIPVSIAYYISRKRD